MDISDINLPCFVDLEDFQVDMNFWQICDLTDWSKSPAIPQVSDFMRTAKFAFSKHKTNMLTISLVISSDVMALLFTSPQGFYVIVQLK